MHPAGARILREDDQQEMSREAVLLQWERKIEEAERRPRRVERTAGEADDGNESPSGRFERTAEETEEGAEEWGRPRPAARSGAPKLEQPRRIGRVAAPAEDATHEAPRRFAQNAVPPAAAPQPVSERRTIKITGQPVPARRRRHSVVESQLAQPDRIALWAFLLGLFLVAVAAGTAHA